MKFSFKVVPRMVRAISRMSVSTKFKVTSPVSPATTAPGGGGDELGPVGAGGGPAGFEHTFAGAVGRDRAADPRRRRLQASRLLERSRARGRAAVGSSSEPRRAASSAHSARPIADSRAQRSRSPGRGGGRFDGSGGNCGRDAGGRKGGETGAGGALLAPAAIAGGARLGSNFGCRVLVPSGPLSETWRAVIRSTRQPLTSSPSLTVTTLVPTGAKIAIRWPGEMTMPVSRVSASPASAVASRPPGGGRLVLLNSGRARIVARSASYWLLGCRRGGSGSARDRAGITSADAAGSRRQPISASVIAAKRAQPASSKTSTMRSIMAALRRFCRQGGSRTRHPASRPKSLPPSGDSPGSPQDAVHLQIVDDQRRRRRLDPGQQASPGSLRAVEREPQADAAIAISGLGRQALGAADSLPNPAGKALDAALQIGRGDRVAGTVEGDPSGARRGAQLGDLPTQPRQCGGGGLERGSSKRPSSSRASRS